MGKPKPKLCMFCGKDKSAGPMSREHFVPRGLWSGRRPSGTLTLPAHKSCNAGFAQDNEYFRDVLVAEEHAWDHAEVEKLRAGEIERKMRYKFGSLAKTFKNVRMMDIRSPGGLYLGRKPVFEADRQRMDRVACNIVRGVFYVIRGHPVPADCSVAILPNVMLKVPAIQDMVNGMGQVNTFGDDVFMCRCSAPADNESQFACLMRFYNARTFFGAVMPDKDLAGTLTKIASWQ